MANPHFDGRRPTLPRALGWTSRIAGRLGVRLLLVNLVVLLVPVVGVEFARIPSGSCSRRSSAT